MKTLKDRVVALTGAGSGIGRACAKLLARHGALIALSDVNEQGLAETVAQCKALGGQVTALRVDLADRAAVHRWAEAVHKEFGRVNVIINNAGVALGSTIETMKYEDFDWLMGINFWGVVHGTKAFLPLIKETGDGHIVNISSVFGLIALPTQGAYNAAKFAVKGFTEALRQELQVEGSPIGVTCVHPGGIKTNIARSARLTPSKGMVDEASARTMEKAFRTTPERAAQDIIKAILKNRRRQLIGADAVLIDLMQRAMPELYQNVIIAGAKRHRAKLMKRG